MNKEISKSSKLLFSSSSECDRTFVSRGGSNNGTFHAPELVNPNNQSRQCLYTFLAAPGQRALVEFRTFFLRGKPPEYGYFIFFIEIEIQLFDSPKHTLLKN